MKPHTIPMTVGIYRIRCIPTGRFYVGSATNLYRRWIKHRSLLRHNAHPNPKLQAAWNKHGEANFVFEILELVLISGMLTAREQYWFATLNPFGRRGFNIERSAESSLGRKHTPEAIEKIRAINTGRKFPAEFGAQVRERQLGKTFSAERCKHISEAKQGKPSGLHGRKFPGTTERRRHEHDFQMRTLIAIDPGGTEYLVHGVKTFCQEHNLNCTLLIRVANGVRPFHKGWTAHYPDASIS